MWIECACRNIAAQKAGDGHCQDMLTVRADTADKCNEARITNRRIDTSTLTAFEDLLMREEAAIKLVDAGAIDFPHHVDE